MKRTITAAAFFALVAAVGYAKPKLHDSVNFAPTWEAAVEEAKLLNVPIVVHNHGFNWGPCWSMHRSVLQNKKYIKFAEDNTVEVICIGGAADAVKQGHAKAEQYEAKDDAGNTVRYMVEFPGMTAAQLDALARSGAAKYRGRGIPYTAIVNPHNLEEMASFLGGQSAKTLMGAVEENKKALEKQYGKSMKRKDLARFQKDAAEVRKLAADGDFAKAIKEADKLVKGTAKKPEVLQKKAAEVQADVMKATAKRLDEIEATIQRGETKGLKRELSALTYPTRGTELEARVKELLEALKLKEG